MTDVKSFSLMASITPCAPQASKMELIPLSKIKLLDVKHPARQILPAIKDKTHSTI
jgi:hypothetical protein